jgi:hypothetical protein
MRETVTSRIPEEGCKNGSAYEVAVESGFSRPFSRMLR